MFVWKTTELNHHRLASSPNPASAHNRSVASSKQEEMNFRGNYKALTVCDQKKGTDAMDENKNTPKHLVCLAKTLQQTNNEAQRSEKEKANSGLPTDATSQDDR